MLKIHEFPPFEMYVAHPKQSVVLLLNIRQNFKKVINYFWLWAQEGAMFTLWQYTKPQNMITIQLACNMYTLLKNWCSVQTSISTYFDEEFICLFESLFVLKWLKKFVWFLDLVQELEQLVQEGGLMKVSKLPLLQGNWLLIEYRQSI